MMKLLWKMAAFIGGVFAMLYLYTGGDFSAILTNTPRPSLVLKDDSSFLSGKEKETVLRFHAALLGTFDVDYRVEIVAGAVDADAVATRVMRERGVGSRSKTGRGVLLYIAPDSNRVLLLTTPAGSEVFQRVFVSSLLDRQVRFSVRNRKISQAILEVSASLYQRADEVAKGLPFDPEQYAFAGKGNKQVQSAPEDEATLKQKWLITSVFQAYVHTMRARQTEARLDIYSSATQEMLTGQTLSPEAMRAIVEGIQRCPAPAIKLLHDNTRAVLRYPIYERKCAPWFFIYEGGVWRLDLVTLHQVIKKDNRDEWYFMMGVEHPYQSAFSDWLFDSSGRPQEVALP